VTTATITVIHEGHADIHIVGNRPWGLGQPATPAELFTAADQALTRNGWVRTGPGWVQDFGGITGSTYGCEVAPIEKETS